MREFLASILDSLLAMPVGAVIGGVFLAFLLALPVAGAYVAARRGARDAAMALVAAAMVTNLIAMAVASGQVWRTIRVQDGAAATQRQPPPGSPPAGDDGLSESLAWIVLLNADTDRDGSVSSGEAARLAEQSVKIFAGPGKDAVDVVALKEAFWVYSQQARVNRDLMAGGFDKECLNRPKAVPGATRADGKGAELKGP
jgi:hypothetical protein